MPMICEVDDPLPPFDAEMCDAWNCSEPADFICEGCCASLCFNCCGGDSGEKGYCSECYEKQIVTGDFTRAEVKEWNEKWKRWQSAVTKPKSKTKKRTRR